MVADACQLQTLFRAMHHSFGFNGGRTSLRIERRALTLKPLRRAVASDVGFAVQCVLTGRPRLGIPGMRT
jgi:hypothetical protein